MYEAVQECKRCGAGLTLQDMRGSECPYCGVIYPHRAQAEQHAQVVGQVMNQMVAQQTAVQNQWRAGFGVPPVAGPPGGPPPGMAPPGMAPPGMAPPGMAPPGMAPPGAYDPTAIAQHHINQAHATARGIQRTVLISMLGTFMLVAVITLVLLFL